MILDIDWQWGRAHQYKLGIVKGEQVIRQVGRGRDLIRPLGGQRKRPLYLDFVECEGSPQSLLAFASIWGLLTTPPQDGAAEPVSAWRKEIKNMKLLLDAVPRMVEFGRSMVEAGRANSPWKMAVTKLDLVIMGGVPGEPPSLMAQPTTLLSAMRLQFAEARMSGVSVRTCANCGRAFEVGGRGGTARKRGMALYCSDPCRIRRACDLEPSRFS
jgi:hypothetical protein